MKIVILISYLIILVLLILDIIASSTMDDDKITEQKDDFVDITESYAVSESDYEKYPPTQT